MYVSEAVVADEELQYVGSGCASIETIEYCLGVASGAALGPQAG